MFGGLRKKLKKVVSSISRKVEEGTGPVKVREVTEDVDVIEERAEETEEIRDEIRKEIGEKDAEHLEEAREIVEETSEELDELEKQMAKIKEMEAEVKHREEKRDKTIKEKDNEFEREIVEEVNDKVDEINKEIAVIGKKRGLFKRKSEKKERKGILKKVTEKELTRDDVAKFLPDLKKALLENDVAFEVADKITNDLREDLIGQSVGRRKIEELINDSLKKSMLSVMSQEKISLDELIKENKPLTVLFLGFNGTGKTTSVARVAHLLSKKGFKTVLAAADTFRAASIEQLQYHADKLGVKMIKHEYGSDPAAVVFDAKKYAESNGMDAVLCDTAGRAHSNVNLMDELKKVIRVNNPDFKILVLDSVTGNDIHDQAKLFNDAVGVDAIILTKVDVYSKGGAALSASYTINKPILYIGIGQGYDDLMEFDPEEIVENLLR